MSNLASHRGGMDHKLEAAHISLGLNDHPGRHLFGHPGAGDSFQPAPGRLRQPWLQQGMSNKEIALALDVSPRTVQKHLQRIYLS
jgi:hypothetical protein